MRSTRCAHLILLDLIVLLILLEDTNHEVPNYKQHPHLPATFSPLEPVGLLSTQYTFLKLLVHCYERQNLTSL